MGWKPAPHFFGGVMRSPKPYRRAPVILGLSSLVVILIGAAQNQQQEPSWKWPESKVFEIVKHVRAGRDLTPKQWPNNSRMAVGLSFDFDNETPSLRDGQVSPGLMAQGEYGARAGLPRVLRLLDQYQIPATFFIPALSAKLQPEGVRSEERRVGK